MPLRVLSWNLMHGRAVPGAGRDLLHEFAVALGGWEWDTALLQEVPPWWPERLAELLGARQRMALTSRNALLPVRRSIAVRWPDAIKSNGGGCNTILVRRREVVEHRTLRLRVVPERRLLHAVRLTDGPWLGNLHASAHFPALAERDVSRAAAAMREWAGSAPALLGGDFNLGRPALAGWQHIGGHIVDHAFAVGLTGREARLLDRGPLSDHPPLLITVA
jgi:endonuclease/exonuclease/phosphatase family metal-dependent hydrolase